jgi:NADH-quinone oxidoreductase subunit A
LVEAGSCKIVDHRQEPTNAKQNCVERLIVFSWEEAKMRTQSSARPGFLLRELRDKFHKVPCRMSTLMATTFLPVFFFVLAGLAAAVGMLLVGTLFGPKRQSAVKQMPYESGMDPIHDARRRFDVRFHLVAIAFVLFDVELLFLYPWAVASGNSAGIDAAVREAETLGAGYSRLLVFSEVMVFLALLAAGFVYVWRKGVFQWR